MDYDLYTDAYTNGSCDEGYFHCAVNEYCISQDLVCNGHQNCGDRDDSDEEQCESDTAALDHYGMTFLSLIVSQSVPSVVGKTFALLQYMGLANCHIPGIHVDI